MSDLVEMQTTTGGPPVPPQNTGEPPVPPQNTGGPPVPPQNTGEPPVPPQNTGEPPVPQQNTGDPPVPQAHAGEVPLPRDKTGGTPVLRNTGESPVLRNTGETPGLQQIVQPPPLPAAPAISTRNLTMLYGPLRALDNLTLELERGDVFGYIGPNGAGKSTTMKILAGLLRPTFGSAQVMGRNVSDSGDFVRRNIGYMPDTFGVYEDLKVSEYLEFFASAYGLRRGQRKKVVQDVLELTDLTYKQDALVDSLSRGMQQRLGLARVLVHDPPVLLLDEPASGLDPRARIEIRELLRELQRLGKTILVSSHILSELGEFCNKLGIIERGKLLEQGTIEDLKAKARAHPVIAVRVVDDVDAAFAVLKSDQRIADVQRENGELLVSLCDPNMHHHFLIEKLVAANIRLHSIAPHEMKLEDVFLRLTRGLVQ